MICHHKWNRGNRVLENIDCCRPRHDDDVDLEMHEVGREPWSAIELSLSVSPLNNNVFPFYVTEIAQPMPESLDAGRENGRGSGYESYSRNFAWLLRPRGKAERKEQGTTTHS